MSLLESIVRFDELAFANSDRLNEVVDEIGDVSGELVVILRLLVLTFGVVNRVFKAVDFFTVVGGFAGCNRVALLYLTFGLMLRCAAMDDVDEWVEFDDDGRFI